MENTLSDVTFSGEDSNIVGALVVGGIAVGCGIIGYVIKYLFNNRDAANAIKKVGQLEKLLLESGTIKPQSAQVNAAPAKA